MVNKQRRYRFLWSNFNSHLSVQMNISPFHTMREMDWNNNGNILQLSRNNKVMTYHSAQDLNNDIKRGEGFLNKEYADRYFDSVNKSIRDAKRAFERLWGADYPALGNEDLKSLVSMFTSAWKFSISHFRATQHEGSVRLMEALREASDENQSSILAIPTEFDESNMELLGWHGMLKEPYDEEKILEHLKKFPWTAARHDSIQQAIETMRQRFKSDKEKNIDTGMIMKKRETRIKQDKILEAFPTCRQIADRVQRLALSRMQVKACWAGFDFYTIPLYEEIARRTGEDYMNLRMLYLQDELKRAITDGTLLDALELEGRKRCFLALLKRGALEYFSGARAEEIARRELKELYAIPKADMLKGISAHMGAAKGRVMIVGSNNIEDMRAARQTFRRGSILITEMTQPNIMDIASRAGAIVTDEGGLLSHAAIISRELGIPCIVGTESATSVFKTGDMVHVDANNGTIIRLPEQDSSNGGGYK